MKVLPLTALLMVICQVAIAQSSECSTVSKASDRLACYDRATPPTAGKKPANQAAAASDAQSQAPLADLLAVENSKLDAKIKNICRGC
jgi:hypothetical protein